MDLEEQDAIRRVAEGGAREQMLVLLGTPTAGSTLMTALTLSQGDPSYAGPLAGIPVGIAAKSMTAARRPSSTAGWATVVSRGLAMRANGMSSNPTTAMSRGAL